MDKNGTMNPQANNKVDSSIEGEGRIVEIGNSNPISIESFQQPTLKTFEGKCMVIVPSSQNRGEIVLTARSKGLVSGKITINTK